MGRVSISVAEAGPVPMMLVCPVLMMNKKGIVRTMAKSYHLLRRAPQRKNRKGCPNGQRHVPHLLEQDAVMRLLLMIRTI
jgi:hypothetical protein